MKMFCSVAVYLKCNVNIAKYCKNAIVHDCSLVAGHVRDNAGPGILEMNLFYYLNLLSFRRYRWIVDSVAKLQLLSLHGERVFSDSFLGYFCSAVFFGNIKIQMFHLSPEGGWMYL